MHDTLRPLWNNKEKLSETSRALVYAIGVLNGYHESLIANLNEKLESKIKQLDLKIEQLESKIQNGQQGGRKKKGSKKSKRHY